MGDLVDSLSSLTVPRFWVHRDLSPDYIETKEIASFVQQHYTQILIPGEATAALKHLPHSYYTPPWCIRDLTELKESCSLLQGQLNQSDDRPLLLVCATGKEAELQLFGQLTQQLSTEFPNCQVRCLCHTCPPGCPENLWHFHWPGIEIMQLADVVIGGAGYNTIYECAMVNVPLISFPLRRQYDRQAQRAQGQSWPVTTIPDCCDTVRRLLALRQEQRNGVGNSTFKNGVYLAIKRIETILSLESSN